MLDYRGACFFPAAVYELDYLRRQSRFEQDLYEQCCGVRHIFGRLEHDGVSAYERRKHFPGWNCKRKVERADESGNADWSAITHRPLVPQLTRHSVAEQPAPLTRGVVRGIYSLLDVTPRFGEWLAHLTRHRVGDFFLSAAEHVADHSEHVTARRCRSVTPLDKSPSGAGHRPIHVAEPGEREQPDQIVPVRRIAVLEVLARIGGNPCTGDEVVELFHCVCGLCMFARKRVTLDLLVEIGARHLHRSGRFRHVPVELPQLAQKISPLGRFLEFLEGLEAGEAAESRVVSDACACETVDVARGQLRSR